MRTMKKSEGKRTIFGRGSAAKQPASLAQTPSGIVVRTYSDLNCPNNDLIVDDLGKTFDAEQLCYMAVEKLEIGPLVAPLFALAHASLELWCSPNEKILCSKDCLREFVLRIRFIPPEVTLDKLPHIDSRMFDYLFQQIRSDFINDRIDYRDKSEEQELGLGVVDMVRYGKQREISLNDLQGLGPRDFIPTGAKNKYRNIIEKKRLQMNFKPYLEGQHNLYKTDSIVKVQLTYMKSIMHYAKHYGMEKFKITVNGSDIASAEVKPYDSQFPGLNIHEGKDGKVMKMVSHFLNMYCSGS